MAIVRTTPKETNTGGTVAPTADTPVVDKPGASVGSVDKTKSVVKQPSAKVVARPERGRAIAPNRGQVAVRSGGARTFINDTMAELRRVVWPSREDVRSGTVVTVGLLIFFAIYIFGLDFVADWLFHALGLYSKIP